MWQRACVARCVLMLQCTSCSINLCWLTHVCSVGRWPAQNLMHPHICQEGTWYEAAFPTSLGGETKRFLCCHPMAPALALSSKRCFIAPCQSPQPHCCVTASPAKRNDGSHPLAGRWLVSADQEDGFLPPLEGCPSVSSTGKPCEGTSFRWDEAMLHTNFQGESHAGSALAPFKASSLRLGTVCS